MRLRPLQPDLEEEARDLAIFLRERFDEIGLSVREYAAKHAWDPGTVSRFLSGARIATPEFVEALVSDAKPQHERDLGPDLWQQGRDLRMKALQQRNARAAEVEQLRQDLSDAEHDRHLAAVRERVLTEKLSEKESEHKSLLARYRALESERNKLDHGPLAIEQSREMEVLDHHQTSVSEEMVKLRAELARERSFREAAENRRDQLQQELSAAKNALVRIGGDSRDIEFGSKGDQIVSYLSDRRTEWGGLVKPVAIRSVTWGIPVYLGMTFRALPPVQGVLRVVSLGGLLIPIWFIYAVRRAEPDKKINKAGQVALALLSVSVSFLMGIFFYWLIIQVILGE